MTPVPSRLHAAAAVRARAIAESRARPLLFAGLMAVLVGLWTFVLLAVGHGLGGERSGAAAPELAHIACGKTFGEAGADRA